MVIDSRKETVHINVENIDSFTELEEETRMQLTYHIPEEKEGEETKMKKHVEKFECAENKLLLDTFKAIRNK
jgi:uncharacterized protein YdeI (YjbR/CyaY-like superfamily)